MPRGLPVVSAGYLKLCDPSLTLELSSTTGDSASPFEYDYRTVFKIGGIFLGCPSMCVLTDYLGNPSQVDNGMVVCPLVQSGQVGRWQTECGQDASVSKSKR
eukprot:5049597-Amphidinium_carterae.1